MSFASLGLHPELLRTLARRGHLRPTPIQDEAIPAALAGRDVIGATVTGSGKTLAYVLPLLQRRLSDEAGRPDAPRPDHRPAARAVRALVLVPARELAQQVTDTFLAYTQALSVRVKVVTLHGGVSVNPQLMALRGGADVLVATPGRLLDLAARHRAHAPDTAFSGLRLDHLETLVLDEADRLLDEGFADELGRVLSLLPRRRQQWLFSATFGPEVLALAQDLMQDPVAIGVTAWHSVNRPAPQGDRPSAASPATGDERHPRAPATKLVNPPATLPASLVQRALQVDTARRTPLLRHLIRTEGWTQVLVFVATRYAAEHVAGKLNAAGLRATALHGELSQGARSGALADFRSGDTRVLVATDMASRGLHLDQLPAVVNFDLARSPATHIHRVGRTARQDAAGVAVSFIAADDPTQEAHFRLIEKRQGLRVPREQVPGFEPASQAAELAPRSSQDAAAPRGLDPNGGVKGRRKSRKDKLREAQTAQGHPPSKAPNAHNR